MTRFTVMYCTATNHATQFMTVQADNAADAKSLVREKVGEKVYFINIIKG